MGKRKAEDAALAGPVEAYNKAAAVLERNSIPDTPYAGKRNREGRSESCIADLCSCAEYRVG